MAKEENDMKRNFLRIAALVLCLVSTLTFASCAKLAVLLNLRTLDYQKIGEGYTVVGSGNYKAGETVVIPKQHNGLPVNAIAEGAFREESSMNLEGYHVQIPESVTKIEDGAFAALLSITVDEANPVYYSELNYLIERESGRLVAGVSPGKIPDGVTAIAPMAFCYAGDIETPVVLPASLKKVEKNAFYGLFFSKIVIAEQNPFLYTTGRNVIEKETSKMVFSAESDIPDGVKVLGDSLFASPWNSNNTIDYYLPASVSCIEMGAFEKSGASSLAVVEDNAVYYAESNCIIEKESKKLVAGCVNSVIPSDVIAIEERAFFESGICSVVIPESVSVIGKHAFGSKTLGSDLFSSTPSFTVKTSASVKEVEPPTDEKEEGGEGYKYSLGTIFTANSLTIWCEAKEQPAGWDEEWYRDPDFGSGTLGGVYVTEATEQGFSGGVAVMLSLTSVYWGDEWEYVDGEPALIKNYDKDYKE